MRAMALWGTLFSIGVMLNTSWFRPIPIKVHEIDSVGLTKFVSEFDPSHKRYAFAFFGKYPIERRDPSVFIREPERFFVIWGEIVPLQAGSNFFEPQGLSRGAGFSPKIIAGNRIITAPEPKIVSGSRTYIPEHQVWSHANLSFRIPSGFEFWQRFCRVSDYIGAQAANICFPLLNERAVGDVYLVAGPVPKHYARKDQPKREGGGRDCAPSRSILFKKGPEAALTFGALLIFVGWFGARWRFRAGDGFWMSGFVMLCAGGFGLVFTALIFLLFTHS